MIVAAKPKATAQVEEPMNPDPSSEADEKESADNFRVIRPQQVLPIGSLDDVESEFDSKTVRKEYNLSPTETLNKTAVESFTSNSIHNKIGLLFIQVSVGD